MMLEDLSYATLRKDLDDPVRIELERLRKVVKRGDVGTAEYFADRYKSHLKYVREAKNYYYESGGRWIDDVGRCYALSVVQMLPNDLYDNAAACNYDPELRAAIAAFGLRCENRRLLESVLTLAAPKLAASLSDFDADPLELNCPNGVVDLRNGRLRERTVDDLFGKVAAVNYDPNAKAPRWEKFLAEIFQHDADLIDYVHRAVGYTLTGDVAEQTFFILHGAGANGKSTFIGALNSILGDYATATETSTFIGRERKSATNDLARLAGARFVPAIESEEGQKLSEALVKSVTGGDPIIARYLFREFFTYIPQFKIWLATNHRPSISDDGNAMWRRLRLIEFGARFAGADRDLNLPAQLASESAGILAWAVRGSVEWQRRGLKPPASVLYATRRYRADEDVLGTFISDRCFVEPSVSVGAKALYADYRSWCDGAGEKPITQNMLGRRLADRGFVQKPTAKERRWSGIALAATADDEARG